MAKDLSTTVFDEEFDPHKNGRIASQSDVYVIRSRLQLFCGYIANKGVIALINVVRVDFPFSSVYRIKLNIFLTE
jgi:hypothetical protein